jgi:CPA2 family monovalent cation:H+ antiporter-2
MTTLQLVLVLLASAVFVVVLFRSLNLPPVLGYLLVGAAIGPHALDLVPIRRRRATWPSSAWCS